jgi:predicted nucleic acid-binding protein
VLQAVNATVIGNARVHRQAHGRQTLSVITVMEIVKRLQKVQQPRKIVYLQTHVGTGEVLEFGQRAAEIADRILGKLERSRSPG